MCLWFLLRPARFLKYGSRYVARWFLLLLQPSPLQVLLIVSVFCVRTALGMALDTTLQVGGGRVDSSGGLCPQVSFGLHGTREAMGGEVFPTSGRTSAQAQRGVSERVCRGLPNLTDSYSPIPRALKIHGG